MSQKVLLRDDNGYFEIGAGQHALAGEAGVDARIDGAVNEIFLLVADVGQLVGARIDVDVAGAAPAHAAAIMLKLNAVVKRHIQHRLAGGRNVRLGRLPVLKLKRDG